MAGMFGNIMQGMRPQQQQGQQAQFAQGQQQARPMFGGFKQATPQGQPAQARPGMFAGMFGGGAGKQPSRFMAPQQQQMPKQNQMQGAMGGMGGMLSDKRSKDRIRELEDLTSSYEALMNRGETEKPDLRQPDRDTLDKAANYKDVGAYSYKYKDPSVPGAAPGEHVGPMAHELRSIPGVVQSGEDGLDRVDTPRLTMANASAIGEQQRDIDELKDAHAALEKRRMMGALDDAGKRQSSRILSDNPY